MQCRQTTSLTDNTQGNNYAQSARTTWFNSSVCTPYQNNIAGNADVTELQPNLPRSQAAHCIGKPKCLKLSAQGVCTYVYENVYTKAMHDHHIA